MKEPKEEPKEEVEYKPEKASDCHWSDWEGAKPDRSVKDPWLGEK